MVAGQSTSVVGTLMGIQTLLKISEYKRNQNCDDYHRDVPQKDRFHSYPFLEVGGENVKRNNTLCDLFFRGSPN